MSYLERVTECEHGEVARIHNTDGGFSGGVMCPGGSRERVTVDYTEHEIRQLRTAAANVQTGTHSVWETGLLAEAAWKLADLFEGVDTE